MTVWRAEYVALLGIQTLKVSREFAAYEDMLIFCWKIFPVIALGASIFIDDDFVALLVFMII